MSTVDIAHLRQWIGKTQTDRDLLSVRHAGLMAATLGLPPANFMAGTPLPPLWHWIYFLTGLPPAELGRDGHPARGGFLPPVPLENRMWAGGSLEFHATIPLGATVERRSSILSVEHKQGRSGELVFVAVLHQLLYAGELAISEVHDLVYKDPTSTSAGVPATATPAMPIAQHSQAFYPDSTTLFRYSALTFNGHRIHYDADYCRSVESYPNLVIHGPLNATMLAAFAEKLSGRRLKTFRYRGLRPSLLGNSLTVNAAEDGAGLLLWIGLPDGSVAMRAEAHFHGES
ncbi:MAG: MaoC family dehydratase N-terminal domain-containing protein [Sulfuricaulis sp.]|nr:MaoC family dehydratase N-terminal domain-containing protein [Sulfuricaulis sp.]